MSLELDNIEDMNDKENKPAELEQFGVWIKEPVQDAGSSEPLDIPLSSSTGENFDIPVMNNISDGFGNASFSDFSEFELPPDQLDTALSSDADFDFDLSGFDFPEPADITGQPESSATDTPEEQAVPDELNIIENTDSVETDGQQNAQSYDIEAPEETSAEDTVSFPSEDSSENPSENPSMDLTMDDSDTTGILPSAAMSEEVFDVSELSDFNFDDISLPEPDAIFPDETPSASNEQPAAEQSETADEDVPADNHDDTGDFPSPDFSPADFSVSDIIPDSPLTSFDSSSIDVPEDPPIIETAEDFVPSDEDVPVIPDDADSMQTMPEEEISLDSFDLSLEEPSSDATADITASPSSSQEKEEDDALNNENVPTEDFSVLSDSVPSDSLPSDYPQPDFPVEQDSEPVLPSESDFMDVSEDFLSGLSDETTEGTPSAGNNSKAAPESVSESKTKTSRLKLSDVDEVAVSDFELSPDQLEEPAAIDEENTSADPDLPEGFSMEVFDNFENPSEAFDLQPGNEENFGDIVFEDITDSLPKVEKKGPKLEEIDEVADAIFSNVTEEIDIDSFLNDSPAPSSGTEDVSLEDFLSDTDFSETSEFKEFLSSPAQEKSDITNDPPIDMTLTFDDDFVLDTEEKSDGDIDFEAAVSADDFLADIVSTGEETFDNFDDIFDNITDMNAPESSPEEPVHVESDVSFDEVSEFDDLLSSFENETEKTETPVVTRSTTPLRRVDYDIAINMDETEIKRQTIETTEDTEEEETVELFMDEGPSLPTVNPNEPSSFSMSDLDDSITFVDETEGADYASSLIDDIKFAGIEFEDITDKSETSGKAAEEGINIQDVENVAEHDTESNTEAPANLNSPLETSGLVTDSFEDISLDDFDISDLDVPVEDISPKEQVPEEPALEEPELVETPETSEEPNQEEDSSVAEGQEPSDVMNEQTAAVEPDTSEADALFEDLPDLSAFFQEKENSEFPDVSSEYFSEDTTVKSIEPEEQKTTEETESPEEDITIDEFIPDSPVVEDLSTEVFTEPASYESTITEESPETPSESADSSEVLSEHQDAVSFEQEAEPAASDNIPFEEEAPTDFHESLPEIDDIFNEPLPDVVTDSEEFSPETPVPSVDMAENQLTEPVLDDIGDSPEPESILDDNADSPEPESILDDMGSSPEPETILDEMGDSPEPESILDENADSLEPETILDDMGSSPEPESILEEQPDSSDTEPVLDELSDSAEPEPLVDEQPDSPESESESESELDVLSDSPESELPSPSDFVTELPSGLPAVAAFESDLQESENLIITNQLDELENHVYNKSDISEVCSTMNDSEMNNEPVFDNSLLSKILDELADLKGEMASIRSEIELLKSKETVSTDTAVIEEEPAAESTGFFSGDEDDETIALSGDELNNILNSADFTEETPESIMADDMEVPAAETSEKEPAAEEETFTEPSFEQTEPQEQESEVSFEAEPAEEDAVSETIESPVDADENFSFDENLSEPSVEDISLDIENEVNQTSSDIPEEIEIPSSDDSFVIDSSASDFLYDSEPTIDEALSQDKVSYLNEDPALDDVDLDSTTNEFVPITQEELTATFETASNADDEAEEIDETPAEAVFESEQWEPAPESDEASPAMESDVLSEDSASETSEPIFEEAPVVEEPVFEESTVEEVEPAAVPDVAEPTENNDVSGMSDSLKNDVKSVLSYMDQLLENLPEEKIAEFAKSEHFEVYKKLFNELGLV